MQLAKPIILDPSEIWEVGVCELSLARQLLADNTDALVYCDLIAPQFIGTTMVRFLRTFDIMPEDYGGEYQFENVYYGTRGKENISRHTYRNIKSGR